MTRRLVVGPRGAERRARVLEAIARLDASAPLLVVAPTVEVAAEVMRDATPNGGSRFGASLTSLGRLAASLAAPSLAARGLSPAGGLALEAVMSRVVHELADTGALGRFGVVAGQPGLPVALFRTVEELRLARVDVSTVDPDLARVAASFDRALAQGGLADRSVVLELACLAKPPVGHLVLVDVQVDSVAAEALVAHVAAGATTVFASSPEADRPSGTRLSRALGVPPDVLVAPADTGVARAAKHLFREEAVDAAPDGTVVAFSAPGDDREALEVARRVRREAASGVPFDRMAILVRGPQHHRAHLTEALRRAGVPAHMSLGTRRPDPSGRAFLALIACKEEDHSARRFSEYVSLGETPRIDGDEPPPAVVERSEAYVAPDDDAVPLPRADRDDAPVPPPPRAPHGWERILVDTAVIRGVERWRTRLAHRRTKLEDAAAHADDEDKARLLAARDDVLHLERFALPLLQELDRLPTSAPWGEWKRALERLADRALRDPERVRAVLAELAPMGPVGPVTLSEVRAVLAPRLGELLDRPESRAPGAVLVGTTDAARGRELDVVFVMGLSERLFPMKVTEDPVLSDAVRQRLGGGLRTQAARADDERMALALAVGAASKRLYLSYSRIDTEQRRQRTPSFYALEILRAAEGRLPSFDDLSRRAREECTARLAWPAPDDPSSALDETEYDLAVLRAMVGLPLAEKVGLARYLLLASPHLSRSLRARAARSAKAYHPHDGLVQVGEAGKAALAKHLPSARSFSPTAVQGFAVCPYRFYLYTVLRLRPRETVERLDELDALERGSFTHEVLFRLNVRLREEGLLPIDERTRGRAGKLLEDVLRGVEESYRERHDPPVRRVWDDGIQAIRADLREWLRRKPAEREVHPTHFELAFGLPEEDPDARDAASRDEPVPLGAGLTLRGSIDVVERTPQGLRASDYKTGKARAEQGSIIGGGESLQPVFYALVLEALFPGERVSGGRLYYCTFAGDFKEVEVPLDDRAREAAALVARAVGDALANATLPQRPRAEGCMYCDFTAVCGPDEERRTSRKPRLPLLEELRAHG